MHLAISRSRVLLPPPLGPTIATEVPAEIERLTLLNAEWYITMINIQRKTKTDIKLSA